LSLSNLRKVDDRPFLVCLVTPTKNHLFIANSTFLRKISHSSQALRVDNIRGSFNGSDIIRKIENIAGDITNVPDNFEQLFDIHTAIGFDENLPRLVEATNNISPIGQKFLVTDANRNQIMLAPARAVEFVKSEDFDNLKSDLDGKVSKFKNEILIASLIENVNIRGRIIEYLIAGDDETLRNELITALKNKTYLPEFKTENSLGDYEKIFDKFQTQTDIKTKIMFLSSNPKAYNIDKMLEFLSLKQSVFMFYFIGLDLNNVVGTSLVSMFQNDLLIGTVMLRHWAGRNSRGVTQFDGRAIHKVVLNQENVIDLHAACKHLGTMIEY